MCSALCSANFLFWLQAEAKALSAAQREAAAVARCSEAADLLQGMRNEIAALHRRLAAHDAAAGAASEVVTATSVSLERLGS